MGFVIMNSSFFILFFLHLFCLPFFTLPFAVSTQIECIPSEAEALLKLKHHLIDSSNRLSSWNSSAISNCCLWPAVVCNNVTAHVVEHHLNISFGYDEDIEAYIRSTFRGEINPCLADLKHLNYLNFSGNYLLGAGTPIPSFLATMTSLTHLDLSLTGFIGNIPHQIGNLSNLLYLDLSFAANGTIPSQIERLFAENLDWLSSLSKLEYLDLGYTNLSNSFDWLHTLQALPSLTDLHLSFCTLPPYSQPSLLNFSSLLTLDLSFTSYSSAISSIPRWIFGLRKLVSLQFRGNNIQGPIPDGIQNLTLLQNLDLSFNSLSSSIPDWLYSLHHLNFLNLEYNKLNGTISDALGNLTSLVELHFSSNQLEGTIPISLGNLTSLVELHLLSNQLEGTIPTSLGNLTSLVALYLSSNQLEGTIPTCLGNLTSLIVIDLSNNQFRGTIPTSLGDLTSLVQLDLSINQLEGTIPTPLGNLTSLVGLHLSNNQFSENPFESLRSLSKLSELDIGHNHFEGVVKEDHLANLTSLEEFDASGNNFTLKVGPNWLPTFQLTYLDMSSWQLGPNFPSWIQSQNKLVYLQMPNTGISDSIPTWFWEAFSQASYVNLSRNNIHGELMTTLRNPISILTVDLSTNHLCGKLPYLSNDVQWLDLSSNSFLESVDDFLCKKQDKQMNLEFLNLASNNLSGEIPDCWMIWPFLIDVNLQSNHFVGNLPPSMASLAELQFLQIRNNSLSGIFPTILKKTDQLICLDLGENNLSGTIPAWVGESLLSMRILRLRSNSFSGHIPNKICNMRFLQVLDLAQNNLSGNIPTCFNHLNAMTLMNRSTDPLITVIPYNTYTYSEIDISMLLWLKGREDEYRNILGLVTSIDLSNNTLLGEIPRELTELNGLYFLNLSHNQLIGHIPPSIGNMESLLSIDFSRNQLSGEIPPTISNLSFLSMLDLSYNHLKGKIPTGTQLQTFDASNFIGNNLWGPPLPINCSSNGKNDSYDRNGKGSDRHGVNWFFISMTFGFVVGFWIVIAPLIICRSWRYAYFHFLDNVWFKLQSFF